MCQNLFETFRNYMQACKRINSRLLDSKAAGESIDLIHSDFVKEFEKAREFGELIDEMSKNEKIKKLGWEWVPERRSLDGSYTICGPTYLHYFFENTGIYQRIRHEKDFDINKAFFELFFEETEKKIEAIHRGQIRGLAVDFGDQKQMDLGMFSIENKDGKDAGFVMDPYFVNKITIKEPDFSTGDFRNKFGDLEFVINLFFPDTALVSLNYESSSLFSEFYNSHKMQEWSHEDAIPAQELMALIGSKLRVGKSRLDDPDFVVETGINGERFEELQAMIGEGEEYDDAWIEFLNKAEEYFVKRNLLGNWLSKTDVPNFKKFINKVWEFMQSEPYNKQEYIKIAVAFFRASFKNLPRAGDTAKLESPINIINYVTALEALYCRDVAELREKLSNRVSNLIGRAQFEKAEIRENLLEIYKIRSKYLHGSPVEIDQAFRKRFRIVEGNKTSKKLEVWLRNIVRKSILSFFSLCEHYGSNKEGKGRTALYERLSNPYKHKQIHDIQDKEASEFLSLCSNAEG